MRKQKRRFYWPLGYHRRRGYRPIPTFTVTWTSDPREAKWLREWLKFLLPTSKEPVS